MPAPVTSEDFLDLLRKSEQVDTGRLEQFLGRGKPLPAEPLKLAAALVHKGLLTKFQAQQLLQGKYRGFNLGGYRLLERLGAGGSGTVFLAEHQVMRRRVAVKVLPPSVAKEPGVLERFRREAQAVAALDHPNIVRAHDFRQENGVHFLVMEFIDGVSLQELLTRQGPLGVGQACDYARQAAVGLQHAHEAGLVHRDVKPANLLVDKEGTVKILDLGLARYAPDGESLTKRFDENAVMGTADYLAPEQALNLHAVDIRADVYSLGATLYALLAGEPPFHAGTVTQKLLWHQMRDPKPLREVRPELPAPLAALVTRMMDKAPEGRPQTPAEVAAALERYCEGPYPPHAARRPGAVLPGGTSASYVRTPAGAPTGGPKLNLSPRAADPDATERIEPAKKTGRLDVRRPNEEVQAERRSFWAAVLGGAALITALLVASVVAVLVAFRTPASPRPVEKGAEEGQKPPVVPPPRPALPAAVGEIFSLRGHEGGVARVAFGPDGRHALSVGYDATVRLWDLEARRETTVLRGHAGSVHYVVFSRDGRRALTSSEDTTVRLWDLDNAREVRRFEGHGKKVWGAVFSPDERQVLSCSEDKTLRLWETHTGKALHVLKGHELAVNAVAISPQGDKAVSAGWDGTARVWDLKKGKEVRKFTGHKGKVNTVAFTSDPRQVLTAGGDNVVRLWEVNTGRQVHAFTGHKSPVWYVAVSPDGSRVLSCGTDKTVRLWDLSRRWFVMDFAGHTGAVTAVAFSPDGKRFVSGSQDGTMRLWGLPGH